MPRPLQNQKELAWLNEMSRSSDPSAEALQQLERILETSPIARHAFGAELVRLRHFVDLARTARVRLPRRVREELEHLGKAKSFDHLVALAESRREEPPALELEPGSSG